MSDLAAFVRESNAIENIVREPTDAEIKAHIDVLDLDAISIADMVAFVNIVAPGAMLRDRRGMDVRIGDYYPPPGGPQIVARLGNLFVAVDVGDAHDIHRRYEALHPFTDGNGRSGRVLWLWMMQERGDMAEALRYGFLRSWYYQSLR